MVLSRPAALACGLILFAVSAAAQEDHQAHHPASAASAAQPAQRIPSTVGMAEQMQSMHAIHDRLLAAKTPQERQALMAEHMKLMQSSMSMMQGLRSNRPPASPEARQQMMEMRMDMMQSMMQMMMDRMPEASK